MTVAERIYSASTNEEDETARLAERLARQIEDDIVSRNVRAGEVLGSLRELAERYSAGRAAAREAVALLERRGLGRLRPGPYGGFVVTRPECQSIGVELANYFRLAGVTAQQLADAREALDPMVASFAAAAPRPRRHTVSSGSGNDLDWYLRLQADLAQSTGEPVIELFVHCLNELTADFAIADAAIGTSLAASAESAALEQALADEDADGARAAATALQKASGSLLRWDEGPPPLPVIETSRMADDRTLSTLVARKLAAEILMKGKAGQRLGSEWDLSERFSVSRATLRQAIRQLQDSGLVECRRGRGNGLVVRDLRGTGSIRLVVAYLIGRQMDPMAAGTLLFRLNRFIPALALSRAGDEQRARLDGLLERAQAQDPIDRYDLLRLVQCVSEMADSPIIDLFSRCLAAYEARFHPFLLESLPAHMQAEYFALLRKLLEELEPDDAVQLVRAKRESSDLMLAMSRSRPI